jgi:hypothetical protein
MIDGLSEVTDCELLQYDGSAESLQKVLYEALSRVEH